MARTQFTYTFSNAQPGAAVHFSAPVYANASTATQDGPRLVLDGTNSVSVWADAGYLIASTVDGNGAELSVTATASSATVTDSDGTAGVNPFAVSAAAGDALRLKQRGAWAATAAYAVNDVVAGPAPYGGTWACLSAHTSGSTFTGWGAAHWQWVGGGGYGTHSARPAATAGPDGYLYVETDTGAGTVFQVQAATWVQITPAVTP